MKLRRFVIFAGDRARSVSRSDERSEDPANEIVCGDLEILERDFDFLEFGLSKATTFA